MPLTHFPVSNGVKQGCVLAPTMFSLLFAQMRSAALSQTEAGVKIHYRTDGDFFNLRHPEVLHQSDSGHCARLPLCRWLRTCGSLWGRPTRAGWLFRHCNNVIWANSEHQENWSVETAHPKHCSAPTQHHHGWKCAEKCRRLQIPRQLHKLCS